MFTPGQDFVCESKGIGRCAPRTPEAASGFKALQLILTRMLAQLPGSKPTIDIDGVIGPSVVLAVQLVAGRLSEGRYPAMSELAGAQPEEAIPYVAQNAMEIAGVFDKILTDDPRALLAPGLGDEEPPFDPVQMLKNVATGPRIAAVGLAAIGITGLALLANASDRRSKGIADRSGMLPESDGSDEFDDDDYDHGDDDGGEQSALPSSSEPATSSAPAT